MAKIKIFKRDGRPSPYFWSDKEEGDNALKTVYKQTSEGVKRMKGVLFDPIASRIQKLG